MATTLSYGFEKPATGDKGTVFWPALEDNIQQLHELRASDVGRQSSDRPVGDGGRVE
jgi:hypothetical protein